MAAPAWLIAVFTAQLLWSNAVPVPSLQHTSGVPRAGVGRPNLDEWTPAEYYTPDCLHPSEAGFRHLFRELARTLEAG